MITAIKAALDEEGRKIDADHYGGGFDFRFGSWDEDLIERKAKDFEARFKRDPRGAIIAGDKDDMMRRIEEYVAAGVSKFVLRPIGADDDDVCAQTQRLIEEVLPAAEKLNDRT